jgi:L-ascorbate metabolism protein UlaG (beta-lactamase superfamily)
LIGWFLYYAEKAGGVAMSEIRFTWLGHATFMVETLNNKKILIDPWVQNNPAYPRHLLDITQCDIMLLTHAHYDHIGDAIPLAQKTGAQVVGMVELLQWLGRKGVRNLQPMNKGGIQHFGKISVTMVHADHSCGITDGDQILYGGEPAGFVVRLENGYTFYHAGDTAIFGDMALIGELYKPQLAMLPIGDHFTMSPTEAAKAIELLGVKDVIPMHFGTFSLLTGTPEMLINETQHISALNIHVLQPGQTLSIAD